MIRINLLPRELQKAARTPVKLFATFLVGVALCLVGLCAYAYLWFNVVVLNERVERKHAEVEELKKNFEYIIERIIIDAVTRAVAKNACSMTAGSKK